MTAALAPQPPPVQLGYPRPIRWTAEAFQQLHDGDLLPDGVMFADGELVRREQSLEPFLWTVEQFHKARGSEHFPWRRTFLVDGVILEQGMMNAPHAVTIELLSDLLREKFGAGWRIRAQLPLMLGLDIDPEPDFAVMPGHPRESTRTPTSASLVIEISDTTLAYDLGTKLGLYAAAQIADYWVVDLNHRSLHVFREPVAVSNAERGFVYRQHLQLGPTESVSPLAVPQATINVVNLLP